MNDAITTEEFHRQFGKGGKKNPRNKYNVSAPDQRTARGRVYASKAEKLYADKLWDTMSQAWAIYEIIEQPRLWLGVPENVYVPDFFVLMSSGEAFYVDVKGKETPAFRKAKKLWAAYGRLPLKIVVQRGKGFDVTEIIHPPEKQ